ncbi:MAG: T9SS type A sorting domain-containing protein [Bacteroidetes bacterium]|nr:T9SS type A sorting domain-containing protein [Bacteroidota bacterium]
MNRNNSNTPNSYSSSQNYPNPFNPSTTINYSIPNNLKGKNVNVVLSIYDVLGRKATTLVNAEQSPGNYKVQFNANTLASGIYFYRITAGKFIQSKKMILLK